MKRVVVPYQFNPDSLEMGGGVNYVRKLWIYTRNSLCKTTILGFGSHKKSMEKTSFYPVTAKRTGYVTYLLKLLLKLPFMNLKQDDVVHVHRAYFAIPFMLFKKRLCVVFSAHGATLNVVSYRLSEKKLGFLVNLVRKFFLAIERWAMKRIDYFVPVSSSVLEHYEAKHSEIVQQLRKENRITIIGSMVDPEKFLTVSSSYLQEKFGHDCFYCLYVGRLADAEKNVAFLLSALKENFQSDLKVRFVFAGGGEDEEKLKSFSRSFCKENPALFLGPVDPEGIPSLMASADCLLLSSFSEASPTVVKESLLAGTPVITSDVGDVREFIVDGENGFVVDKLSTDVFREKIQALRSLNLTKESVRKTILKKLDKVSPQGIAKQFLEIYENVSKIK